MVVIAKNLKDGTLVSWYLKSDKNGKFKALAGRKGVTERKSLKFDNPGQLVLNQNTILYSQVRKRIGENEEHTTDVFAFDMTEAVKSLKNGKGIDECLLGKKKCQINKIPSIANIGEIEFLQYVGQIEGNDLVAFLAKQQSSDRQILYLTDLLRDQTESGVPVYEFEDPIDQLYVRENGDDIIVTAISEENIITFNRNNFEESPSATIIPANSVKTLSDFVRIIHGQLTPDIIASSTVAPITVTERTVTSEKVSPTSPASVSDNSSQFSSIATETDEGDASSTEKPTTASKITVTSQATERVTVPTNAPTTPSNQPTQTDEGHASSVVYTIPSTKGIFTGRPTVSTFTTTLLPQPISSTQSSQLSLAGADESTNIGLAFLLGVLSLAGTGFMGYKLVQSYLRNHAAPSNYYTSQSSLQDLIRNGPDNESRRSDVLFTVGTRERRLSSSSDSNQSSNHSIYEPPVGSDDMPLQDVLTMGSSETNLDSILVTSGNSRASGPSPRK